MGSYYLFEIQGMFGSCSESTEIQLVQVAGSLISPLFRITPQTQCNLRKLPGSPASSFCHPEEPLHLVAPGRCLAAVRGGGLWAGHPVTWAPRCPRTLARAPSRGGSPTPAPLLLISCGPVSRPPAPAAPLASSIATQRQGVRAAPGPSPPSLSSPMATTPRAGF